MAILEESLLGQGDRQAQAANPRVRFGPWHTMAVTFATACAGGIAFYGFLQSPPQCHVKLSDAPTDINTGIEMQGVVFGQPVYIQNIATKQVMGIHYNNPHPGATIGTWTIDWNWDKVWRFTKAGYIENVKTGQCMGIQYNRRSRGGTIGTWIEDGNWDKKWSWNPPYIQNDALGLVMGIEYNNKNRGATIGDWTKDSNWDKKWELVPAIKASVTYDLVFSTDGRSHGSRELKFYTGLKTTNTKSTEYMNEIKSDVKASLTAAVDEFTGSMSASVSATERQTFKESYSEEYFQEKTDTLTVYFDRPCYVYQLVTTFQCPPGTTSIKGRLVILSKPLR